MKIGFIFLLFSFGVHAQYSQRVERDRLLKDYEVKDVTAKELNDYPEIHLDDQSIIQSRNQATGIYEEPYYSLQDQSRLAIGYSLSQDYQNPMKAQSVYATYMNKIDNFYQDMWWALQFKRTQGEFNALHTDPDNGGRGTNQQGITLLGAGVAHNFWTLADIFESKRLFETVAVYFNYNFHVDSTDDQSYQGFGYTAEYSLVYRSSRRWFYGGKFSYNWAQVERPDEGDEDVIDRSLVFGWTTLGFELGFYF
ncbi:MAG: hypothetical protein VYA54_08835 [Bdellovibrionota bacterium]|nr:hypothetical protein [Bdellovibrionota bacterium]